MQTRCTRYVPIGVVAVLGACLAWSAWGATGPRAETREAEVVTLTLEQFVHSVLANHPDLEVASRASARDANARPANARPTRGAPLVVRPPRGASDATEAELRDRVNRVLLQAIQAYWNQVRDLGAVEIRKKAVAAAETLARRAGGSGESDATDLLLRSTAETFLAETRIALHRATQRAADGEDALKLLMNDETLSVSSDTRLLLLTEPVEPPAATYPDETIGLDLALRNRLGTTEIPRDKAERKRVESLALEVRGARRRIESARTMFLLARDRVRAAEKALEAADETEKAQQREAAGGLLIRIRAQAALADAQLQLLAARVDHEIALADWDRATGQLHERWSLRIQADS